jgi:hypothetical protein
MKAGKVLFNYIEMFFSFFFSVGVMYSGEYDVSDVIL